VTPVEQIDWEFLESMFAEMAAQGVAALKRVGADPRQITLERAADMRYVGQGRELTVELPAELLAARRPEGLVTTFSATYQRLFNRRLTDVPVEALNWRLVVSAPAPRVSLGQRTAHGASLADARKKPRQAYFPDAQGFTGTLQLLMPHLGQGLSRRYARLAYLTFLTQRSTHQVDVRAMGCIGCQGAPHRKCFVIRMGKTDQHPRLFHSSSSKRSRTAQPFRYPGPRNCPVEQGRQAIQDGQGDKGPEVAIGAVED